jgi:RNA polymerase sigma-70 factor, ECF subfamily
MIEELYDTHAAGLRRFALSLTRESDEAEDLVQETFVRALAHNELLRILTPVKRKTWLYTVLKNCLVDRRRRQKFETACDEAEFEIPLESCEVSLTDAAAAVGLLPANLRGVIVQKYWLGMTSTEIARGLRIPAATVRFRLHSALHRLKAEFNRPHKEAL